jgi:hypothetical protein
MMAQCLKSSLIAATLARLEPYQDQYTFDGIKYAPLMYRICMCLLTIDSVVTTKSLCKNLDNIPVYAASLSMVMWT